MGSSNSRSESTSTPRSGLNLKRRLLASLFCGGASSHSPIDQIGDHPDHSSMGSLQNLAPYSDLSVSTKQQSASTFGLGTRSCSSTAESGSSSGTACDIIEDASVGHSFSNHSGNHELCCLQLNVNDSIMEARVPGTHVDDQSPMEPFSLDATATSLVGRDTGNPHSLGEPPGDASRDAYTADSGSNISGSLVASQQLPRFLLSIGEQGPVGVGLLLVDVVSINSNFLSSSIAEISNHEARRNTRRMFLDAFSRNSFRRNSDSSTFVLTTSHADDLGSRDRWLLNYSGDLQYDGVAPESRYLSSRSNHRGGRPRRSRYELSERFHDVNEEHSRTSLCTMGLHPCGTCSCESSFIAEESSSRANISQIIVLADALFEVLEEIHHHRMSLSLSSVTLPAPEDVVNSFPLKNHKKSCGSENGMHDAEQCHICLANYEEGDIIRVLPCSHEYHMSCVDKWLKEIHGVCPLCREDVCKVAVEGAASNPEIPSH